VRTASIFILLIYWSVIILAPVLAKNKNQIEKNITILPLKKPLI